MHSYSRLGPPLPLLEGTVNDLTGPFCVPPVDTVHLLRTSHMKKSYILNCMVRLLSLLLFIYLRIYFL